MQKMGCCGTDSKSFGSPQTLANTLHIWLFCPLESQIRGREYDSHGTGCSQKNKNQCQKLWEGRKAGNVETVHDALQIYIHNA